jgi:hypothetical protein
MLWIIVPSVLAVVLMASLVAALIHFDLLSVTQREVPYTLQTRTKYEDQEDEENQEVEV